MLETLQRHQLSTGKHCLISHFASGHALTVFHTQQFFDSDSEFFNLIFFVLRFTSRGLFIFSKHSTRIKCKSLFSFILIQDEIMSLLSLSAPNLSASFLTWWFLTMLVGEIGCICKSVVTKWTTLTVVLLVDLVYQCFTLCTLFNHRQLTFNAHLSPFWSVQGKLANSTRQHSSLPLSPSPLSKACGPTFSILMLLATEVVTCLRTTSLSSSTSSGSLPALFSNFTKCHLFLSQKRDLKWQPSAFTNRCWFEGSSTPCI